MYNKMTCPHCKVRNLLYLGNWDDCTNPMVTSGQCWKCSKYFLADDSDEKREFLLEIMFQSIDSEDNDLYKMTDTLLSGGKITLDGKEYDLSDYLKYHAISNKGEECK